MNYNKFNLAIIAIMFGCWGCSYSLLVKKNNIIDSSPAYLIKSPEQILILPVDKFVNIFSLDFLKNKTTYKTYEVCGIDAKTMNSKIFKVFEQYLFENNKMFKEEKTISISACILLYTRKKIHDLGQHGSIEYEYQNSLITYKVHGKFDHELLFVLPRMIK